MGFLITILIIVVVWRLLRLFFPFILLSLVKRQQKRWGEQFGGQGFNDPRQGASQSRGSSTNSSTKSGDVRIDVSNRAEKQVSKNVGESVDFEEIKD